jgi:hypothetical protein
VQLAVESHENSAQASAGVGAQDAESLAIGRRDGNVEACGTIGIVAWQGRRLRDADQRSVDVGVANPGQALAGRPAELYGRQAFLGVAVMLLEELSDESVDQAALLGVEGGLVGEQLGDGSSPVTAPDTEGSDELVLVDQSVLKGQ